MRTVHETVWKVTVTPAKAGVQKIPFSKIKKIWIPAFAGMTPGLFICVFSHNLARYQQGCFRERIGVRYKVLHCRIVSLAPRCCIARPDPDV